MQRVLVIGCGGAGKTEFARRLAEKLNLPLVHLDRYYWNSEWVPSDEQAWEAQVQSIIAEPQWILDGNYASTLKLRLERADAVIFLDYSTITCVIGILRRLITTNGQTRPDMAHGCKERLDFAFLRYAITFRRYQRPKVLQYLVDFPGAVLAFTSRKEAGQFLADNNGALP